MNKTKELIPKLRFPEFKNKGGWDEKSLEGVAEVNPISSPLPNEFVYVDLESVENGVLLKRRIIKNEGAPSRAQRVLKDNDVIFQMVRPYQKNNYYFKQGDDLDYVASTGYAQLRAFESSMYLYQFIHTDTFVSKVLEKCTGSNYPAINASDLSKILIQIPRPNEQQKIAACLSSLDEVITAHSQKLYFLQEHRKGLMQNLFPQEGEKVPKYRFKEFKSEWKEITIGEVAKVTTGNKDTQNKVDNGKFPFFVRSQTVERINSFTYEGEAILTSGDGVGVGKNFHYIDGKFDFHQRVYCIYEFRKGVSGKFLYLYFSEHFNSRVSRMSAKNSVDSVRMGMITEMPICLPPTLIEQQKIASCLSALDELIAAQAEKIEQLKQHKKGLMQSLFPKMND